MRSDEETGMFPVPRLTASRDYIDGWRNWQVLHGQNLNVVIRCVVGKGQKVFLVCFQLSD